MRIQNRLSPTIVLLSATLALSACQSVEERADKYYQDALTLISEGDIDRAIVELRNALQLEDGHREARLTLADLNEQRGNLQGVYRQYLRLAEFYPDDLDVRLKLAEMAFLGGNRDELERHVAKIEELAPDDPRARVLVAARAYTAAVADNDAAARREAARTVAELMADQPDSIVLHAVQIDDDLREANYSGALAGIDWMIANDPDNLRYYQQRLQVLAQLGDRAGIEAQLGDMVEKFPDNQANKAMLLRFYLSEDRLDDAEAFLRSLAAAAPLDKAGPTIDLIRFLSERRSIEAAQAEIAKAIAERPDPVPFQVLDAGLDFQAGKRDQAVATLQSVLATAEPSDQTRHIKVTLARMLSSMGNEVGARTLVEEVLAEDPTQVEALKMQAVWLTAADDTDGAINALRTAIDQDGEDAQAMSLMAEAYARAGKPDLARDFLSRAVEASRNAPAESIRYARLLIGEERYLPAEDVLISALRLAPQNPELLTTLGGLYLKMEDYGRAQSVADALRRLGTDASVQAANQIEAERLNRQSGAGDAIAYLEELADGADATFASKLTLLRARLATGDIDGALKLAEQLKAEDPDNPALDFILGATQAASGDLDAAEETYKDLLETDQTRPQVWLELVRLYQRQGYRDAAKSTVDDALANMPDDPKLLWAKASFLEQDGDVDGAIAIYETLYERNSRSAVIANNLASLLSSHRSDPESLERAWTIARRFADTEIPAMQDTYGWILHLRGDSAGALPYLEAAAEGLKTNPLVLYHLGKVYVALDRPAEARPRFEQAIQLAGPADRSPEITEARQLAQTLPDTDTPAPAEN
ncbi:TPR domain protein, putative component of TonB system (plasmid) [Rhodovulum sp. P5]|uniref:tetratricopeptide repeat protein n=1 Tax=Rhodovulum sp. P5 TaxID=1564506 RepID=UPI0009C24A69|nr:tetratricopeptide repeat protein [Rhodovulum sp. P5]ARE42510.1 TPR domain protein, putative component of TonB system [Rhodovulum sp. P5]